MRLSEWVQLWVCTGHVEAVLCASVNRFVVLLDGNEANVINDDDDDNDGVGIERQKEGR